MAVRWGTRPDQHTVVGTLETLPRLIEEHRLTPPATMIVGDVVALRDKLTWFEKLPLFGKQVVVTRARGQAEELAAMLRTLGAEAIELPVIDLRPAADTRALDAAIAELPNYDWIIFTSTNAVSFFLEHLDHSHTDVRSLRAKICAIGEATRDAIQALHLKVDVVPEESTAEGIVSTFERYDMKGKHVLLPRAVSARELVPETLRKMGAHVDVVDTYQNVIPADAAARAAEIFGRSRKPDWVTFTSSSTVKNLLALVGHSALSGVRVASIGPVTSNTARMHALPVDAEAKDPSMESLVEAMCGAFNSSSP